jgi:L-amino acid N-acyltransferase YncA
VQIRDAHAKDLASVVAIYNAAIPGRTATADTRPVSVESREAWFREHSPAHHPLWVAEADGVVGAWLSLSPFYGRPAYAHTAEVSLYVDADRHGRGLGTALLSHAVERSAGLGLETLVAFIFAHNTPSLVLFSRHGFARWGLLPRVAELDGVKRDLIILGRPISA